MSKYTNKICLVVEVELPNSDPVKAILATEELIENFNKSRFVVGEAFFANFRIADRPFLLED